MIFSAQDNAKLLQELKTITWKKNQSKSTLHTQKPYSIYLIDPIFPGVNSLSAISFENDV